MAVAVIANANAIAIPRTSMNVSRIAADVAILTSLVRERMAELALSTKRAAEAALFKLCNSDVGSGRGRLFGRPLLHRSGILAARVLVAIDELDHADWRTVAGAVAGLEHARVTAVAGGVARPQHVE